MRLEVHSFFKYGVDYVSSVTVLLCMSLRMFGMMQFCEVMVDGYSSFFLQSTYYVEYGYAVTM
jgi:hypothetical protein